MKKKIIIGILLFVVVAGSLATWYVFFKPHRNVGAETAKYILSAEALSRAFKTDSAGATKQYINQAVQISGTVASVEGTTVSLNNVACNVDSTQVGKLPGVKPGSPVRLQGLVVGYNDLMEEVTLAECVFK